MVLTVLPNSSKRLGELDVVVRAIEPTQDGVGFGSAESQRRRILDHLVVLLANHLQSIALVRIGCSLSKYLCPDWGSFCS